MGTVPSESSGVLLLRAWAESDDADGVRVRVLVATPASPTRVLADVVGADAVCDVIDDWLRHLTDRG